MSTILCIGDLHCKTFLLPFIDQAAETVKPDRIIVVGDYMDNWGVLGPDNIAAFKKILAWASERGDVTLLFGNHDMAYYSFSGACAGNDALIMHVAYKYFDQGVAADILKVADASGDWLFTHAGLCKKWARKYLDTPKDAQDAAHQLNEMPWTGKGRFNLERVGRARSGGWDDPSPLWADWSEIKDDHYPKFNQVVGHSPVDTCVSFTAPSGKQLWNCDTFSSDHSGSWRADGSMLLVDTDTNAVEVIGQRDRQKYDEAYDLYLELK